MIDLETLRAVKTILVHGGGCPDGIASAILLHDALPSAEVRFIQYNSEEHTKLEARPNMLFADFTMKEASVQSFVDAGAIVLDHHKGAKDIVAAFGENGRFGDEVTEPGVCGAVLCFRHVWQPLKHETASWYESDKAENFATLAGIRDTWQRKDERWDEACAQAEVLRFYPPESWLELSKPFAAWADHSHLTFWTERRNLGKALVAKHARSVEKTLDKSWRFTSARGTRVVTFEGTSMSSDASDVASDADLVIGFGYHVENGVQKLTLSTRTRVGYDCLGLCKWYGGGGHSSAAGFSLPLDRAPLNPYQMVERLVDDYEVVDVDAKVSTQPG